MEEERTTFQKFKDYFSIIFAFGLVALGMYTYRFYIRRDPLSSLVLFATSTFSMFVILALWRKFTEKYAPEIIYWTTQQKWLRKAVAGGSFSYYEYEENVYKIGLFEPIRRFLSMMIAFIGIASSFAKAFGIKPESPVANPSVALAWAGLILLIPVLLTPIVPIIWAMEDLQLKSWNDKYKTNRRVSRKYKRRFNSLIAIGSLGIAYGLSSNPELDFFQNVINFMILLRVSVIVLTYPIAVLTLLYYLYFRGTVIENIRNRLNIPMAETRLIYRNINGQILDSEGNVIAEKPASDDDVVKIVATGDQVEDETPSEVDDTGEDDMVPEPQEEDKNIPQKIGSGVKNTVTKTGDAVVGTGKAVVSGVTNAGKSIKDNTIGRLFGKKKEDKETDEDTAGKTEYKYTGGSATAGLWDDDKPDKKKDD